MLEPIPIEHIRRFTDAMRRMKGSMRCLTKLEREHMLMILNIQFGDKGEPMSEVNPLVYKSLRKLEEIIADLLKHMVMHRTDIEVLKLKVETLEDCLYKSGGISAHRTKEN